MRETLSDAEIEQVLRFSIIGLIKNDWDLIQNGVHENTINSRLAFELNRFFPVLNKKWGADVEYNRNIDEEKRNEIGLFRPDIIVHSRNTHDSNLLYIEAKKEYKKSGFKADEHNVKYALGNEFNYQCGAIVVYNWSRERIWYAFYSKENGKIRRRSDKYSANELRGYELE